MNHDTKNLDVKVRVGWVKGLKLAVFPLRSLRQLLGFLPARTAQRHVRNRGRRRRLRRSAHRQGPQGILDSTRSGKPPPRPDDRISIDDAHWAIHGVHAQNYHIFTPAVNKDWTMAWGSPTWTKEFPWSNAASDFSFKAGEPGKLVLEFWITPFDYAGPEGPQRAVESVLAENKLIGLAWAIIDYDNVESRGSSGFWNLTPKHSMYGHASELCAFKLMPLEPACGAETRSSLELAGHRHGPSSGRIQGPVSRHDHGLELGFRRWQQFHRAAPAARLRAGWRFRRSRWKSRDHREHRAFSASGTVSLR